MKAPCPYCGESVDDRFFGIHMFLKHRKLRGRRSTIIPDGNVGKVNEKECFRRLKNSRKLMGKGSYNEVIELLKGIPGNFSGIGKVKFRAGEALAQQGYLLEGVRYMEVSGEFSQRYPFWLLEVGRVHDAALIIKERGNSKALSKLFKILNSWSLEPEDLKDVQDDLHRSYILLHKRLYEDSLKIIKHLITRHADLYPAYVIGSITSHYVGNEELAEKLKRMAIKKFGKFPLMKFPKEKVMKSGRPFQTPERYSRENGEVRLQCVMFYSADRISGGIEEMMRFTGNFNMDDAYIGGILKVGNSYALFEYIWGEIRVECELYSARNYVVSVFGEPDEEINYISPNELPLRIL